jgi:hypothetical protein
MKTYAITFNLTTDLPEHEVDEWAAEVVRTAMTHLALGERLELADVQQA